MVAAATISRESHPHCQGCAPLKSEAESSAASIPRGCHARAGRASASNAENACERFFWALQGVNFNVYGLVSHSGDLVERYEYTPYGRRTVYSRGWLRADLNGDGVVSSADLVAFDEADSGPNEGASIADVRGQGYLSEDAREEDIQERIGLSVADDPLVMHSRLESFRTDSQRTYSGSYGGYGSLCDIGHQGLLHDKEFGPAATGLVHNRARTLNPHLGRFNQRDPMDSEQPRGGYHDGMNLYQYASASPVDTSDPTGLKCLVGGQLTQYRIPIAAADAYYVGTPHADAARWLEGDRERNANGLIPGGKVFAFPRLKKTGPGIVESKANNRYKRRAFKVAYFLFFVSVDVCNPEDCRVEVWEKYRAESLGRKGRWQVEQRHTVRAFRKVTSMPPWNKRALMAKRRSPVSGHTHKLLLADMPTVVSRFIFPRVVSRQSIEQEFRIFDKPSGARVATLTNSIKIGFTSKGALWDSP
jgi:RHS repeat-associated protein